MDDKKNSKQNVEVRRNEARIRFLDSLQRVSDNLSKENTLFISLLIGIVTGLVLYSLRWMLSKVTRVGLFYYIFQQVWKIVWKYIQKQPFKSESPEEKKTTEDTSRNNPFSK
ncbi:hypothetical protein A7K93_11000 [Candidatus Methylacidiphilum fumarolicum]|uniref:Uncharacterized protein n=2 Tax=Candidatus Methylacidiphilum fumarolicum TaxID=591154 RepID=I0K056_METFB|nr:hypothetical protein [Candidatus Methylacidiphilum fumarolicum]MBW6414275.1 hypothetical protein [Candidatus Methylacidiphilum fumarolicum]TFE70963.1 hypothetical protein A7K73_00105 [Candidatus Methylacidiphilum fumarolicum]TFE71371.1 hypothetical protein A7K93_11000 [Candidatus Methylacidiphilum fumarolicum]TFE74413.1 hypothetical protein A7K72_04070 [Candidatus Methylacidiphilum fumarolicum]TFE76850.1 hypothetical protein A7D33_07955 [Candidatus Methylacidiphilum fumarolicum]